MPIGSKIKEFGCESKEFEVLLGKEVERRHQLYY